MFKLLCLVIFCLLNTDLYCKQDESKTSCEAELRDCYSDRNSYRLSKYRDIYAIIGSPNTKIQVSLKYKITSYFNLYLGYTQTMFWDIGKESSPFKDISFNPDLFYSIDFPKDTFVKAIDIGIYEHESNGKDGLASRSWSGSYLKFYTIVRFNNWSFNWDTKLYWFYKFQLDNTNFDIREYSGFWNSRISFINYYESDEFVDRITFYFDFFAGGKYSQLLGKGAQELGVKFRMGAGPFYPCIFLQLYHGYNESLLDYNVELSSYRIGIAF